MASEQEIQIQAVIQAVAQGQDISQFDPQAISAAKHYVTNKANELNKMVNSTSTPPNVTREMMRNELDMYQGFADKIAEDDPQFASAMDVAFIGMGVYAAAKYGPMAATKLKTAAGRTYGYAQEAYGQATGAASRAYGQAGGMASGIGQKATAAVGGIGAAAQRGYGAASDFASRGAEYMQNRGAFPGTKPYSPTYGYGQKVAGAGKGIMSGIGKGIRKLLRIPI